MKRAGDLWPRVTSFENLLDAARKARKGKRFKASTLEFDHRMEEELVALRRELSSGEYRPGAYFTFEIFEPKRRLISAAPYRDRVVHHALCNVIGPVFEKTFVADSFANRVGYGTHRALRRFTGLLRSSRHILQCDVRKYFPSMDHEILKSLVRRKIKCPDTLRLADLIIDGSNEQEPVQHLFPGDTLLTALERRHGMPIGNLTSQLFANVYLNPFDHFVKERLGAGRYVRFVDDFAIFSDDRGELREMLGRVREYLAGLRLVLNTSKTRLERTASGADFLGFRVLPDRIRVRRSNLRRARRRLKEMVEDYRAGRLGISEVTDRVRSWVAHLEHGDTWRLRGRIFSSLVFTRAGRREVPTPVARRLVEQQR